MTELSFNRIGFQSHLNQKHLMGSHCTHCDALFVPPHMLCTNCFHTEMEWQELSGSGVLVGFTVIHIGLSFMIAQGYGPANPYCSGMVQLAEGPIISGQLVGFDCTQPETIQVGTQVQAVFLHDLNHNEESSSLAFAPLNFA
jgi:uncharacterized protein